MRIWAAVPNWERQLFCIAIPAWRQGDFFLSGFARIKPNATPVLIHTKVKLVIMTLKTH
jgi:hypothetical protein